MVDVFRDRDWQSTFRGLRSFAAAAICLQQGCLPDRYARAEDAGAPALPVNSRYFLAEEFSVVPAVDLPPKVNGVVVSSFPSMLRPQALSSRRARGNGQSQLRPPAPYPASGALRRDTRKRRPDAD